MTAATKCGSCDHDPACGFSTWNGVRYCHDDDCDHDEPLTCFQMLWATERQMASAAWRDEEERE